MVQEGTVGDLLVRERTFFDFNTGMFVTETIREQFTISSGTSQFLYEYTLDGVVSNGAVPILINGTDDADTIAEKTRSVIAANQSTVLQLDIDGRFLNIVETDLPITITHSDSGTNGFFFFGGFVSSFSRGPDFGEYALSVRPTSDSGAIPQRDVLMVDYQFGIGDVNRVEDQGQLIISSNFISDSAGSGVSAVSDQRGDRLVVDGNFNVVPGDLPSPGSTRLLRNQNTDSLIPGVVIINNVIAHSGDAAVEFGGAVNTNGSVAAPAAFGRIVNNTIVNRGSGDGIRISGNSSPTVLNNIFSGLNTGIEVTNNQAGEIVVGGNAYQDNGNDSDIPLSSDSFVIPTGVPLFEDPDRGVYIPAMFSDVIDSSFASLDDRSEFVQTVKQPSGISPSPIIAPEFDAYGQRRVDDPLVTTPGGVGSNVFIDRGAIDRADDVRPSAVLTGPQDAIGFQIVGGDQDQDASYVRLNDGVQQYFEVQLVDPSGTGIDADTVTDRTVILTENGNRLSPGRDYVFGYSSNSNTIRLTPLTGIWRPDAVYEITLNNKERFEVTLPSGDAVIDGDMLFMTETNGNVSTFEYDAGYVLSIPAPVENTLTVDLVNGVVADGDSFTITTGSASRTFEFDTDDSVPTNAVRVNIDGLTSETEIRDAILNSFAQIDPIANPPVSVAEALGLNPTALGSNAIVLDTDANDTLVSSSSAVVIENSMQGNALTYSNGIEQVTFEFTQNGVSDPLFTEIPFTPQDSSDDLANRLVTAINNSVLGLNGVQVLPSGEVLLGGSANDLASLTGNSLQFTGTPGVGSGNIRLPFVPVASFSSEQMIANLQNAIRQTPSIVAETFNPGGGTLLIDGAIAVDSDFDGVVQSTGVSLPPVADFAGNRVRETRANDETRFTIIMPGVRFDFGDAPITHSTRLSENGARHTVSSVSELRLGAYLDTEDDGQPLLSDDALLGISVVPGGTFFTADDVSGVWTITGGATPSSNQTLSIDIGGQVETFELVQANDNPQIGNIPIRFGANEPVEEIMNELLQEISAAFEAVGSAVLAEANGDTITLEAIDDEDGVIVKEFAKAGVSYLVFTDNPNITGNLDDEDVTGFINPSDPSGSTIPIFVTGTGLVDIWIDFAKDGFDNGDHVISGVPVSEMFDDDGNPLPNLINIPQSNLPTSAFEGPFDLDNIDVNDKDRWMRVRLSQSGDLSYDGVAVGGEVEDTLISIAPFAPPVPQPDDYQVLEDTELTVDTSSATPPPLTENDDNAQEEDQLLPVRYFIGDFPENGRLITPSEDDELNGSFRYIPNPDFVGVDTFTYRLSTQRNSGVSAADAVFATVTIEVLPVNDAPGVEDKSLVALEYQPGETPADQPTVYLASELLEGATGDGDIQMPGLPFDESNQDASLRVVSLTVGGVTIDENNQGAVATTTRGGQIWADFITEPADPSDPFSFERTVITQVYYQGADFFNSDNLRDINDPPLLDNFTFTIEDDGRFVDGDGNPAMDLAGNPLNGTPARGSATAEIRVTPQNSTPHPMPELVGANNPNYINYFVNQGLQAPIPTEDIALVIPSAFLLENDLQGNPAAQDENLGVNGNDGNLRITSVSMDPALGNLEIDPSTGDLLFTPVDDIYGEVTFTYEVEDQGEDEDVMGGRTDSPRRATVVSTVFIEPVNDVPVAYDRSFELVEAIEPAAPAVFSFTATDLINGSGVNADSPIMISGNSITLPSGAAMNDGETLVLTDTAGQRTVVEFSTDVTPSVGTDILVTYNVADTDIQIAAGLAAAFGQAGIGGTATDATVALMPITNATTSTFTTMIGASNIGVSVPDGSLINSGDVIRVTDAGGINVTVELSTTGTSITGADAVVTFAATDDEATIMEAVQAALVGLGIGSIDDTNPAAGRAGINFSNVTVDSVDDPASQITTGGSNLVLPDSAQLIDGETIQLSDNFGTSVVVEFNTTGTPGGGTDIVIQYAVGDSAGDVALLLETALRGQDWGVVALTDGSLTFTSVSASAAIAPTTSLVVTNDQIQIPPANLLIDGETITWTVNGGPVVIEFNTTGVASTGTDYVVQFAPADSADSVAASLATAVQADGFGAVATGDTVDLYNVSSMAVTELPSVPGVFDPNLGAPYNEQSQALRVIEFATDLDTLLVTPTLNGEETLETPNGLLTLNFSSGIFTFGTYAPNENYNELPPFDAVDLFRYRITDNGNTELPGVNLSQTLPPEESVEFATVTITVAAANDKPYIEHLSEVDVQEDATGLQAIIEDVFTKVLPGPEGDLNNGRADGALDELLTQGRPTVTNISVTDPAGVMSQDPIVTDTGDLIVFPATDAVGQAVYVFTFTDDHPTNPQSTDATVTINVRAVNDAPRFDPAIAGISGVNGPDDAFAVARQVDPDTGEIIDATITYTLREDNSQPVGQPDLEYFIPFERDPTIIGYNPVGLLDVFLVGPSNESATSIIEGGGQTLPIDDVTIPPRTVLGGSLRVGIDSLGRPGVFYDPPENFNNDIDPDQPVDSFEYFVTDDGQTYVGTGLTDDPQTSSNTVLFNLNPVNDRPQFTVNLPRENPNDANSPFVPIETSEDSSVTTITNFAFGIEAGPPQTAFDEVRILPNGELAQPVRFSIASLGFPETQSSQFFTEFPTLTVDGRLTFQPAPDVFGSFEFEVVLTDDGPGNESRGDLISSVPITITINVQPVNDPPSVGDGAPDLVYTILETDTLDIPNNGPPGSPGMLDVMVPGPENEGPSNPDPGGGQTIRLNEPTPIRTAFGGTLEQILENGEIVGLRYTPRANFVGTDSFIYTVIDDGITIDVGSDGTERPDPKVASNTVTIEVGPVNNPPQFSGPINVSVEEDAGAVSVDNWATNVLPGPPTALDELATQEVYFTVTQVSGDTSLFTTAPSAIVNDDDNTATLEFEPAGDANGIAIFEAQAFDIPTDGTPPASSVIRTFTLTIESVNDPPTFDTPMDPVSVIEDSGPYAEIWATNISPGPADESDQSVRFEVATPPDAAHLFQGAPQIADDGTLRFIPAANANGTVDLTVTAIDSGEASSVPVTLRLIITAENDRPVANPDTAATTEDDILVIAVADLLANDVDPDIGNPDDTLTIQIPADSLSLSGARVQYDSTTELITYDPTDAITLQALSEGASAVDSFTYSVVDSQGEESNIVTVAISVDGLNDAPVAVVDNPTLNPDGPTLIPILVNDSDVDGQLVPTSIEVTLQPAFGTVTFDDNGIATYEAFQAFTEEDQFRYRVADDLGAFSNEVLVTINANAAPIARDDQAGGYLEESVDINVIANDIDPDALPGAPNGGLDLESIEIVSTPFSGAAVPLDDGTIRYIPIDGFVGLDSFQYRIADSEGRYSSPGTVQVRIVSSRLQNPNLNEDVNDDGTVTPIDALLVINRLSRDGSGSVPVMEGDSGPPFYDVDGNQLISPIDALRVINELERRTAVSGEGEQIVSPVLSTPVGTSLASDRTDEVVSLLGQTEPETPAIASDASEDDSAGVIELIAIGHEDSTDEEDGSRLSALDAAFGDLI